MLFQEDYSKRKRLREQSPFLSTRKTFIIKGLTIMQQNNLKRFTIQLKTNPLRLTHRTLQIQSQTQKV